MLKHYVDESNLKYFREKSVVTEIIDNTVGYILATGKAKSGITYYSRSGAGTTESPYVYTVVTGLTPDVSPVNTYYVVNTTGTITSRTSAPSVAGVVDYVDKEVKVSLDGKLSRTTNAGTQVTNIAETVTSVHTTVPTSKAVLEYVDDIIESQVGPIIDAKVSSVNYGTATISGQSFTGIYTTNGTTHAVVAVDSTAGGTHESTSLVTSGAVNQGLASLNASVNTSIDGKLSRIINGAASGKERATTIEAVLSKDEQKVPTSKAVSDYVADEITKVPTAQNGQITIQSAGTTVGTFTVNQSNDTTINIPTPTVSYPVTDVKTSDDGTTYTTTIASGETVAKINFKPINDAIDSKLSRTINGATTGKEKATTIESTLSNDEQKVPTSSAVKTVTDDLDTRLTSAEGSITSLNTTVSGHTTSIGTLNTTVSGHTTSIGTLNTTVGGHTTAISDINTALDGKLSSTISGAVSGKEKATNIESSLTAAGEQKVPTSKAVADYVTAQITAAIGNAIAAYY